MTKLILELRSWLKDKSEMNQRNAYYISYHAHGTDHNFTKYEAQVLFPLIWFYNFIQFPGTITTLLAQEVENEKLKFILVSVVVFDAADTKI